MELTGIKYLRDLNLEGRRIFCRVDFNVPLRDGAITDDNRIRAALPTVRQLSQAGAQVALASHLGRPKGRDTELSLEPCAARLAELLDSEVRFADDCVGDGVEKVLKDTPEGGVCVLENLRFHSAEKKGDPHFSKALAHGFQVYVNDAFGTCHRAHASMYGIVQHLPDRAAGLLIEKEIKFLGNVVSEPRRPFVAVLGGAKVSDKIGVIRALLGRCEALVIGGAMAYTFLVARGHQVGESLVEPDKVGMAKGLLERAQAGGTRLLLPIDHRTGASIDDTTAQVTTGQDIPDGEAGFDIGPKTVERYSAALREAGTVFWNGPLGVFENPAFNQGTFEVARVIADSDAISVIGGGDSAAAVMQAGLSAQVSHVSTGGGASLQLIEGTPLPGIEALRAGHEFH